MFNEEQEETTVQETRFTSTDGVELKDGDTYYHIKENRVAYATIKPEKDYDSERPRFADKAKAEAFVDSLRKKEVNVWEIFEMLEIVWTDEKYQAILLHLAKPNEGAELS